jgi:hypothetical protein
MLPLSQLLLPLPPDAAADCREVFRRCRCHGFAIFLLPPPLAYFATAVAAADATMVATFIKCPDSRYVAAAAFAPLPGLRR